MAVEFVDFELLTELNYAILTSLSGDVLTTNTLYKQNKLSLKDLQYILSLPIIKPICRVALLNEDETVRKIIPNEDIIAEGSNYSENYQNGERKSLTLSLFNGRQTSDDTLSGHIDYPYLPSVQRIWYGTKFSYDIGFEYNGEEFYFPRGIFVVTNFELAESNGSRSVNYTLKDKFSIFTGNAGVILDGYEIPVGTPIGQCISDLLNTSCADGTIYDSKTCFIDKSYDGFVTQQTIRLEAGAHISEIFDALATQMSAEYYYNNNGNLSFYPMDESMNITDKPIVYSYNEDNMQNIAISSKEEIVNVVKVVGNNVDGETYSAVAKNTNLQSPINIYNVKERAVAPIESENIFNDEMALELAEYNLRNETRFQMSQQFEIVFNPLLLVNMIIEISNKNLNTQRSMWLINAISSDLGGQKFSINISSLDALPLFTKKARGD